MYSHSFLLNLDTVSVNGFCSTVTFRKSYIFYMYLHAGIFGLLISSTQFHSACLLSLWSLNGDFAVLWLLCIWWYDQYISTYGLLMVIFSWPTCYSATSWVFGNQVLMRKNINALMILRQICNSFVTFSSKRDFFPHSL